MKSALETRIVNDIINDLQNNMHHIMWHQFRKCNAYTANRCQVVIGNTTFSLFPVRSYDTIVGFEIEWTFENGNLTREYNGFYEVGKYSVTTSRQMTQINRFVFDYSTRYFYERNRY